MHFMAIIMSNLCVVIMIRIINVYLMLLQQCLMLIHLLLFFIFNVCYLLLLFLHPSFLLLLPFIVNTILCSSVIIVAGFSGFVTSGIAL